MNTSIIIDINDNNIFDYIKDKENHNNYQWFFIKSIGQVSNIFIKNLEDLWKGLGKIHKNLSSFSETFQLFLVSSNAVKKDSKVSCFKNYIICYGIINNQTKTIINKNKGQVIEPFLQLSSVQEYIKNICTEILREDETQLQVGDKVICKSGYSLFQEGIINKIDKNKNIVVISPMGFQNNTTIQCKLNQIEKALN